MEQSTIPVISIVGRSNSGKTTLIERLIPELRRLGYRVATIKHNLHGFDIDHEGKDSWRHKQAGAQLTVVSSPGRAALMEDIDPNFGIADLVNRYIRDVDLVLLEGFKGNPYPKIEVYRPELHPERLCNDSDNLIALVTEHPAETAVANFQRDEIGPIAALIESRFLKEQPATGKKGSDTEHARR
jgi:molybdopterin-guanine dinucleotide biosynthesis adapter protein